MFVPTATIAAIAVINSGGVIQISRGLQLLVTKAGPGDYQVQTLAAVDGMFPFACIYDNSSVNKAIACTQVTTTAVDIHTSLSGVPTDQAFALIIFRNEDPPT